MRARQAFASPSYRLHEEPLDSFPVGRHRDDEPVVRLT
jgi:hypothetical protein